jgi:hypothetical protein
MWFVSFRTNVAPFAGLMLKGYKKRGLPCERVVEEIDDAGDNKTDDVPRRALAGRSRRPYVC